VLAFDHDEECVVDHTPQWAITSRERPRIPKLGADIALSAILAPNFGWVRAEGQGKRRDAAVRSASARAASAKSVPLLA
jgi:hypothetical protein